jgi:hypothetical protein
MAPRTWNPLAHWGFVAVESFHGLGNPKSGASGSAGA